MCLQFDFYSTENFNVEKKSNLNKWKIYVASSPIDI